MLVSVNKNRLWRGLFIVVSLLFVCPAALTAADAVQFVYKYSQGYSQNGNIQTRGPGQGRGTGQRRGPGHGPGFRGGRGPDAAFAVDRDDFHFLLQNHEKIRRQVTYWTWSR